VSRSSDIYLIPAAGGEPKKVTFDSASEREPLFSADAKKLYFVRSDGDLGGAERPSSQLFCMQLEKLDKDPEDAEAAAGDDADARAPGAAAGAGPNGGPGGPPRARPQRSGPPSEPKIDWAGLKRRTRQVTRGAVRVSSYIPARDSRMLIFIGSEGLG